jgi:uncharacterized protein YndB with AHSA1/START domain
MTRYTFTTHVAAPPGRVFALWTNLDRMREWVGGVDGVTDVSGPIDRAGTTYVIRFGQMRSPIEIVDVERPRRFATQFGNWLLRGRSTATFEPEGSGTRLTQVLEAVGLGSAIMAWLSGQGSYQGSDREELEAFARIAERESGSTS